tara:strand:+ start:11872 stop:12732 length:861 start_codon:yes stop_codon:yes gene_type:complete
MPLVQLDFSNPLNTSVQTGDVAYFSNPIDYGTAGNSLNNGDQWSSTTTPHLTSNQSDIIKIGVIETIIPWDGTVSSIICDMPQNLFNQYFSKIQTGGCTPDTSGGPLTNSCDGYTLYPDGQALMDYAFINEPTVKFQFIGAYDAIAYSTGTGQICDAKKLLAAYYHPQTGSNPAIPSLLDAQSVINFFKNQYNVPGLSVGMSRLDFEAAVYAVDSDFFGHTGASSSKCKCTYPEICVDGSFIMFSKDNKVNLSSALGYYASVTFKNNSTEKAELFNVGADVFESSK